MQILHCLWEKRGRNTSNIEIEFEKSFSKARCFRRQAIPVCHAKREKKKECLCERSLEQIWKSAWLAATMTVHVKGSKLGREILI